MFATFPAFLRLSLCMLFSVSLHGSVAFFDWLPLPAEPSLAEAPIAVSFEPIESHQTPKEFSSATKSLLSTKVKPSAAILPSLSSAPETEIAKVSTMNALPPALKAEKKTLVPSEEMVCMAPQEVVSEELSELFAERQPENAAAAIATVPDEVPESTQDTVAKGLLDSAALSAYRSTLIEATPNYHSNPLPEYPYLARQKHWEGVVWLLVDVTAEGLVDDLQVEQSCGHRVLDQAASKTVRRWQFSPARRAGLPVSSQARIPVRFRLEDG